MMAKAQDRQAQIKMRQAMKDTLAGTKSKDPEEDKKEHAEIFDIE